MGEKCECRACEMMHERQARESKAALTAEEIVELLKDEELVWDIGRGHRDNSTETIKERINAIDAYRQELLRRIKESEKEGGR